jgi:hypothetical protein
VWLSSVLVAVPALCSAQSAIPLRQLGPAAATDPGVITLATGVRILPDGRALVNDFAQKRLIILDSTLKRVEVVADASGNSRAPYWPGGGALLAYVGDSTVFVDQASQTFTVIDPSGKIIRAIAAPVSKDVPLLMAGAGVGPPHGFDPMGRLVYKTTRRGPRPRITALDSGVAKLFVVGDSNFVVRADPTTRSVDTVVHVASPNYRALVVGIGGGVNAPAPVTNPLPTWDEWALMPDGTVAVVRVQDYHIDWYAPDGTKSSTPKMAFDWRRVTDEDKQRMIDSARRAYDIRVANTPPRPPPRPSRDDEGMAMMAASFDAVPPVFMAVDPSEIPDYYPPIRPGSVKADRDGNLWIIPTTSLLAGSGFVYDVINREGRIVERVRIPAGRIIVAFGKNGLIYMISQTTSRQQILERARVVR